MSFNPTEHLISMKGGKLYLPVQWRIRWFRNENPHGVINTEIVNISPVIVRCTITNNDGIQIASGHGSATSKGTEVWSGRDLEKAETAAIGRALRSAGYGTEFSDDNDDDIADSPIAGKTSQNGGNLSTQSDSSEVVNFRDTNDIDRMFARFRADYSQGADDAEIMELAELVGKPHNITAWNAKYATRRDAWLNIVKNHERIESERPKSETNIPF